MVETLFYSFIITKLLRSFAPSLPTCSAGGFHHDHTHARKERHMPAKKHAAYGAKEYVCGVQHRNRLDARPKSLKDSFANSKCASRVACCPLPTIPEKENSNQFETRAVQNDHDKPKTNTKNTLDRGPEWPHNQKQKLPTKEPPQNKTQGHILKSQTKPNENNKRWSRATITRAQTQCPSLHSLPFPSNKMEVKDTTSTTGPQTDDRSIKNISSNANNCAVAAPFRGISPHLTRTLSRRISASSAIATKSAK